MKTFTVDLPDDMLEQFRSEEQVKRYIAEAIATQLVAQMTLTLEVRVGE